MRVGAIGLGNISTQYFATLPSLPGLELVAVADLDAARASEIAAAHGVSALTVDALLASQEVDIVLNLTTPDSHAGIDERAIRAGKHVYAEKPLALRTADAASVIELAAERGLRVGSAPDTVLGTGIQTARAALEAGLVGRPVGAAAFWASPGHEAWHPAPAFYYQPGAGPLFDMGPYYLTALVTLLGPVTRVSGLATRSNRPRIVETGRAAGHAIPVDVDTHITALLEHSSGATSTVTMSFEVWASRSPGFELFGASGTIAVPDPNAFSDPVEVWTSTTREWESIAPLAGYVGAARGYGLADMAHAIATDRQDRASGALAYHVLEIMEGILAASADRSVVALESSVEPSDPVTLGSTPSTW